MNIAQPVASEVDSVDFSFLSSDEIRSISVKCIENDSTFDSMLNPVPGGLYDPALGSFGDSPCATCNLSYSACPGHPGHIQLPVPVYHPIFMDQAYRLLRATCVYCKGFRLPPKDLHMYMCKLRLLQYGLVREAHIVGSIGDIAWVADFEDSFGLDDDEAEEDSNSADNVIRKREKYVRKCLRLVDDGRDAMRGKHEGRNDARREIIKEFLAEITKTRTCASCGGISPSYRMNRSVNVFEKSLSDKERAKMAQRSLKFEDAMARVYRSTKLQKKPGNVSPESPADPDDQIRDADDEVESAASDQDDMMLQADMLRPATVQRYINPMEVKARLFELFNKEQDLVFLLYNSKPRRRNSPNVTPEMFFLTNILVPPNRYRPEARTGDSEVTEAQQNSLYKSILRDCRRLAQVYIAVNEQRADATQLHQVWTELQQGINSLVDKTKSPVQGAAAKRLEDGIKQILEKKEGLFRKNLMGKRVDFAARSVISPDPNIETNEIGVPPVFAQKLTYPEPVTSHNFRHMQQAVINGSDKWPGAVAIENENGQVLKIGKKTVEERISLANQLLAPTNSGSERTKNKKVYRHLTNGDVVLMNRQPTLHKPSIMGHRVRVLQGEKTIRMHYANCNTYNADFDGDEMNMHFPQNELARAEALQIADTDHQYLSGTQGKPLRGLIQDHISISIALCNRDTLFSRSDYHQLVYSALRPERGEIFGERIQLTPPAIIKPLSRWTGKQVITTILKNLQPPNCGGLTLHGQTQIRASQWGHESEEGVVLIEDGEFITGVLDKSQIGQSSGGLVHAIHEIYGPATAGKLLSCLSRLLTRYLHMRAFSCGMDDLILTPEGERSRRRELQSAEHLGLKIASGYVSLVDTPKSTDVLLLERLEEVMRDDSKHEGLDLLMNQGSKDITSAIQKACIPDSLSKPFPRNQMQVMTTSGAKGSKVNASLISCNLGQQVLESRRVPVMVSGKTLPCFSPFDTDITANGYIKGRFLTGIRPQDYYFHHMAGREGLIDTAVKTSRSGYLQRCVIKGLEGLTAAYDTTVRDADGSIIQFLYGEDGLDVTKQDYLHNFSFILRNVASEAAQLRLDSEAVERHTAQRDWLTKYMKSAIKHAKVRDPKGKDPLIGVRSPSTSAFVTSERFYEAMSSYLTENTDGLVRSKNDKTKESQPSQALTRKNAEVLLVTKYLRSLVEPGEAVGVIAGQSVGEPSTQMTLNTFHLAGHSAVNVTQGIPRLREILMTASREISSPSMSLYPLDTLPSREAEKFAKSISALPLSYILDSVTVEERIGKGRLYGLAKSYRIKFNFFPSEEYTKTYAVEVAEVMAAVASKLLRQISMRVKTEFRKRRDAVTTATPVVGDKTDRLEDVALAAAETDGGDASDHDDPDEDATGFKERSNRTEAVSYGANDEEDNEVQKAMGRDTEMDQMSDGSSEGGFPPEKGADSDVDEEISAQGIATAGTPSVLENFAEVTEFECDKVTGRWCKVTFEYDSDSPKLLMLNVVQDAVAKTLIREVPGIGSCSLQERELDTGDNSRVIHVDGINIKKMQSYSGHIDPHRIQTNDIAAVLSVYGVEACRSSILRELVTVFSSHGITVNNRHLNLIADYMTRNGGFTAFSRMGLRGNVSPFTKMSFETTLAFLKDALLDGDLDELTTPSSRLAMGKLGKLGTGSFDVFTRLPTQKLVS